MYNLKRGWQTQIWLVPSYSFILVYACLGILGFLDIKLMKTECEQHLLKLKFINCN